MHLLPIAAVLGSIISLTVGTSYGKQLFPVVGPGGTAAFRVVFAAVILLAFWRPWRSPLSGRDFKAILLYGITLGLMNFVFYEAIGRLPMGVAIAIEFTGPLTVALISSRRLIDFLWIALTVFGLYLLLPFQVNANSLDPTGVAFAFASALCWGLYIIFGKGVSHLPSGSATSWGMLIAAITIFPLGFGETGTKLFQAPLIVPGFELALASSAIPYTLEMYALKKLPKNTFGILMSLEPAFGALTGFFILHEILSFMQWFAIGSIMSASIGATVASKPEDSRDNSVTPDVL
jgi:inner membrane transporter RhtA